MEKVRINTNRFGEIEIDQDRILRIKGGILGFPESDQFVILDHEPGSPFRWLQSVQQSELAFVVTEPVDFFPDYHIEVRKEELSMLDIDDAEDAIMFVILSLRGEPKDMTANLQGPVVVNSTNLLGRQIVLRDGRYTTKHYLFPEIREEAVEAAQP